MEPSRSWIESACLLRRDSPMNHRGQDDLTRRDLLRAGSIAAIAADLYAARPSSAGASSGGSMSCILLVLLGGPSQLDTWDMKPDAPAEIAATVYQGLGLNLRAELPGPDGCPIRLVDDGVRPIRELF
jgi:hypothetical protein